jgi:hypothetical protein
VIKKLCLVVTGKRGGGFLSMPMPNKSIVIVFVEGLKRHHKSRVECNVTTYLCFDTLYLRSQSFQGVFILSRNGNGDVVHDQIDIVDVLQLGLHSKPNRRIITQS